MIQVQVKLRLTEVQERKLLRWMLHLTGVWNWAIRKIELTARDGVRLYEEHWVKGYFSQFDFQNLLAWHNKRMGMPSHVIGAVLRDSWTSWDRCFKKISKKPRLKGLRNRM